MAYTICDQLGECKPLRIIAPNVHGVPEVKAPFKPYWWVCDPCNPQDKRYEVTYRVGQKDAYFSWWQIVTSDDTDEDIQAKVDYYKRVIAARVAMDEAAREYRRLTGCGWSAVPPQAQ